MSTAAERARARRKRAKAAPSKSNTTLFYVAIGVIVALFGAAIFMTRSESTSSDPGIAGIEEWRPVSVEGGSLPTFTGKGEDAAIGMTLPDFEGATFAGDPVRVTQDGRPKVIVFMAHWCPHCQVDATAISEWARSGGMPQDVDFYGVSTWADPNKPNFPPSEWLEREGWPIETIADDKAGTLAAELGLGGTPYYIFVDDQGVVQWRYAGELQIPTLEEALAAIR